MVDFTPEKGWHRFCSGPPDPKRERSSLFSLCERSELICFLGSGGSEGGGTFLFLWKIYGGSQPLFIFHLFSSS